MSRALDTMAAAWAPRHITIDQITYRLESVTSASLAGVGLAYLEGLQAQASVIDPEEEAIAAEAVTLGQSPEEQVAAYRQRQREISAKRHASAISTPAGQRAYQDRIEAYAAAAVSGCGMADEVALELVPGIPGAILHPVGYAPKEPVDDTRLSRVAFDDDVPASKQIQDAAARGEMPVWALPATTVEYLGRTATALAGGRAGSIAAFRACSNDACRNGPDSPEVRDGPMERPAVAS